MPYDGLSDQESLVLAIFRYGLALNAYEVAVQLGFPLPDVIRICWRLVSIGILDPGAIGDLV